MSRDGQGENADDCRARHEQPQCFAEAVGEGGSARDADEPGVEPAQRADAVPLEPERRELGAPGQRLHELGRERSPRICLLRDRSPGDRHGQRGHGDPADEQPDGQDEPRGREDDGRERDRSGARDQRDERRLEPAQIEVLQRVDVRDEASRAGRRGACPRAGPARAARSTRRPEPAHARASAARRRERRDARSSGRSGARARRSGRRRSRPSARGQPAAPRRSRSDTRTCAIRPTPKTTVSAPSEAANGQSRAAHLRDRHQPADASPSRSLAPHRSAPAVERDDPVDVLDELGPVRDEQHHPPRAQPLDRLGHDRRARPGRGPPSARRG